MTQLRSIEWKNNRVIIIDQSLLPHQIKKIACKNVDQLAEAVQTMRIRGAPALAVAGGMGVALAAVRSRAKTRAQLVRDLKAASRKLELTRPTAVNLFVGVRRVLQAALRGNGIEEMKKLAVEEAQRIAEEDININRRIGRHGAKLVPKHATILTHCNAGALATAGYGTALGVIRAAHEAGRRVRVMATETRPLLQGARLTTLELTREGIPVTLIVDSAAGFFMSRGDVDLVVVGADRIAANGDTANKIGTRTLAILAHHHRIPFYVAAPLSTVDFTLKTGREIPIEFRDPDEVNHFGSVSTAPGGVKALNPAFDITPSKLITAIITEHGVVNPSKLRKLKTYAPNL